MSIFISQALAQEGGAAPAAGGDWFPLIMMVGFFAIMYFMLIRPQRKRQKEHQALVDGLSKGDEVVLASGMLGKVTDVDDTYIGLEAGDGIKLRFQKVAVHAVLPKGTIKSI